MIQDVDSTLERLLAAELASTAPKEPFVVTFGPPTDADEKKGGKLRVNLYLHDLRENLTLRDESFHVSRKPGENEAKRFPGAVTMDLSYLVTVHGDSDPQAEHRLLSEVLSVLLRSRFVPEKYLADSLKPEGPNAMSCSVAQPDHPAHADPPALWQALGGRLRPTLGLVVTARFNPFETRLVRVVREAIMGLGQGVPPGRPLSVNVTRLTAAGIVTGEADAPLGGVIVTVDGRQEAGGTDEKGFFYMLDLPTGRHTLRFEKRGYEAAEASVVSPPPGRQDLLEPVEVALKPLKPAERRQDEQARALAKMPQPEVVDAGRQQVIAITGRLKYADGRNAAYVPVKVGGKETTTDGEGFYTVTGLAPGSYDVVADIPGHGETVVKPTDEPSLVPLPGEARKASKQ